MSIDPPRPASEECFVPHVGWLAYEPGDAVLHGLREGDFEHLEMAAAIRFLRPGDVVVDAGAHAGLYTLLAANFVAPGGRVVAIEPSPATHALLAANAAALDPALVSTHACALGRDDASLGLVTGGPGESAYNRVQTADDHDAETLAVPGRSLCSLLRELGIAGVDLLKLDVEGSEIAVLEGAAPLLASGAVGAILIEFNEENLRRAGGSCTELARLLSGHGYRLFSIDAGTLEPRAVDNVGAEAYTNYLATRDEAALKARLAESPEAARRAAREIHRRGAWANSRRQATQAGLARQHEYIEVLQKELKRLEAEAGDARRESERLSSECRNLLEGRREAGQIAQRHIDRLLAERREAQANAQATIDRLLADGRRYARVIEEQNAYIASLERERDELRAGPARRADDGG